MCRRASAEIPHAPRRVCDMHAVSDCSFTLGGSGIILHGHATAIVANSRFGRLCAECYAISAPSTGAQVAVSAWLDEAALRDSVDFDVCLAVDGQGRPLLHNAPHCPAATTLVLRADTGVWGQIRVDGALTLSGPAPTTMPRPLVVRASFALAADASIATTHLDFRQAAPTVPVFTGAGSVTHTACAVLSGATRTPMAGSCAAFVFPHGSTSGQCAGSIGDVCVFGRCDAGYARDIDASGGGSSSGSVGGGGTGGSTQCLVDGSWSVPPPVCAPRACASVAIEHSDRSGKLCKGTTGDVCEYSCDEGYAPTGAHVCGASGRFAGGGCRSTSLCADSRTWRDPTGAGCAAYSGASNCNTTQGMDQRTAAETCPVSCGLCGCKANVDADAGGVSCPTVLSSGLCSADGATLNPTLAGVPLWTVCCKSCRVQGCDGIYVPKLADGSPAQPLAAHDQCGVCLGDNSTCAGCDGVVNSGLSRDTCGVCEGRASSCCHPSDDTCHRWPTVACTPTGTVAGLRLWLHDHATRAPTFALCADSDVPAPVDFVAVPRDTTLSLGCASGTCVWPGSLAAFGVLELRSMCVQGNVTTYGESGGQLFARDTSISDLVWIHGSNAQLRNVQVGANLLATGGARVTAWGSTLHFAYIAGAGSVLALSAATFGASSGVSGVVTVLPTGQCTGGAAWGASVCAWRSDGDGPFDAQCDASYTNLTDPWRATDQTVSTIENIDQSNSHNDFHNKFMIYTGVGGGRWYRFVGAGGTALALRPPPQNISWIIWGS
eukprot:SAG25_NODE_1001_length_4350_cov_1.862856_3_plen_775_part_00